MKGSRNSIGRWTRISLFVSLPLILGYSSANGQSTIGIGSGFVVQSSKGAGVKVCVSGAKDLACLNGDSGRELWSEPIPGNSVDVGPVISGSTLIFMGGGGFFTAYGLALKNGHTEWTLDRRSPALAAGANTIYLATQGGLGILAVDGNSGRIEWKRRSVVVGGTLKQIAVSNGLLYTDSPYVLDASSGEVIKKLPFNPRVITVAAGTIYATGPGMPLYALDASSSAIRWTAANPIKATPQTTPDVNLVASEKYVVAMYYKQEADITHQAIMRVYAATSGKMLWEKKIISLATLTENIIGVDDQHVYLIEDSHAPNTAINHVKSTIKVFDARSGHHIWQFASSGWIQGPIVRIGNTVFASGDAAPAPNYTVLYAINSATGVLRWKFSF